jgi:hypothetical protein
VSWLLCQDTFYVITLCLHVFKCDLIVCGVNFICYVVAFGCVFGTSIDIARVAGSYIRLE